MNTIDAARIGLICGTVLFVAACLKPSANKRGNIAASLFVVAVSLILWALAQWSPWPLSSLHLH